MFDIRVKNYSFCLLLVLSINLIHHNSGLNKNQQKLKSIEATKEPKHIDIESETQRAIDDNIEKEVTTIAIDLRLATNETTTNETLIVFETNSTSNATILMSNETEITTSLNDSLVPITDETPDHINSTDYNLILNLTTTSFTNSTDSNDTTFTSSISIIEETTNSSESSQVFSENVTQVTETLQESPIFSSTLSVIEALTDRNIDSNSDLSEEMVKCVFDNQIECKNYELICYGLGEVDCGYKYKRSAQNILIENIENRTEPQVFKLSLEKQPLSENIQNTKCVLKALQNMYFSCDPWPSINDCSGRAICKPKDESTDVSEGVPFWKVGLIAALTAIGFICFIIVAVIAFVSYNKLKVRPESSNNGFHQTNPHNITRV